MVDEGVIGIESVEETLKRGKMAVIEHSKGDSRMKFIDDLVMAPFVKTQFSNP